MSKKILIAPNSFKEVAGSTVVAKLFNKYLGKTNSSYSLISAPVSDGGDGFLDVCKSVFDLELIEYQITTPYDDATMKCEVGYQKGKKKLYIESALVLGLKVIPVNKRNPLTLSSKGFGDLLLKIQNDVNNGKIDVDEIIIGVGGTGTNDLGLGMCSRYGLCLYDFYGKQEQVIPENFPRVKEIIWSKNQLPFGIKVISDVLNPLLGSRGATKTFGPQKGADKGELRVLELGFNKIVKALINNGLSILPNNLSGSGGGLTAGLQIFFDAKLIFASEFISNVINIEEKIKDCDIVITGEGGFDNQTFEGKGAGIVLYLATKYNKKVFLCCGRIEKNLKDRFDKNIEIVELESFFENASDSMSNIEKGIEKASQSILSQI
jgi:glycerate 2-kinase